MSHAVTDLPLETVSHSSLSELTLEEIEIRRASLTDRIPNRLLAALPPNDYRRMLPNLEEVELTYDTKLLDQGDKIRNVYFPNSGMISLLAAVDENSTLIAGVVGREGMSGLPLFLGAKKAAVRAVVQGEGTAMRMSAANFEIECEENGALQRLLLGFPTPFLSRYCSRQFAVAFTPWKSELPAGS